LAYAADLKSVAARHVGSSPTLGIKDRDNGPNERAREPKQVRGPLLCRDAASAHSGSTAGRDADRDENVVLPLGLTCRRIVAESESTGVVGCLEQ
jgi:hypothetical protein